METYGVAPKPPAAEASSSATTAIAPAPMAASLPIQTEEDDLDAPVPTGAGCKRLGCKATWEGADVSRGQGEKAECKYHPQAVSFVGNPHHLSLLGSITTLGVLHWRLASTGTS